LFQALWTVLISIIYTLMFFSPILCVHPFLQSDYQYDAFTSAAYLALSHVILALSVAFAFVASVTGYGGNVSTELPLIISRVEVKVKLLSKAIPMHGMNTHVGTRMAPVILTQC
jgi:hypothetical protein